MINPKDVTIIIPHFGQTKEQEYAFDQCYQSLKETVPEIEIVVVKNGPACPHPRDIRIVEQGQCKAVNAGVAITNTPWVFVTNDDMIYPPGWWERLTVNKFTGQQGISDDYFGTVSPRLIEPREGSPTFKVYFCGGAGGDFDKQKFLKYAEDYPFERNRKGFNLPFLIKRELWDTIGGYDINYDPWGSNSDSDLEYKIKLAGGKLVQSGSCIVYHFSQTSGTFEPRNQESWNANWQYFIDKWGFPRTDEGIWEASFEIPTKAEGRIFNPDWEGKYAV